MQRTVSGSKGASIRPQKRKANIRRSCSAVIGAKFCPSTSLKAFPVQDGLFVAQAGYPTKEPPTAHAWSEGREKLIDFPMSKIGQNANMPGRTEIDILTGKRKAEGHLEQKHGKSR